MITRHAGEGTGVRHFVSMMRALFEVIWPAPAVNVALQAIGHQTIGNGGAVALQNFFENTAMLVTAWMYTLAMAQVSPAVASIITVGILVLFATFWVSWRLPPDPRDTSPTATQTHQSDVMIDSAHEINPVTIGRNYR